MRLVKDWDYTIELKDLNEVPDDVDRDAHAATASIEAAHRVRSLASRVVDEHLEESLEEIAWLFDEVAGSPEPNDEYNHALRELYDLGDAGKTIWVK